MDVVEAMEEEWSYKGNRRSLVISRLYDTRVCDREPLPLEQKVLIGLTSVVNRLQIDVKIKLAAPCLGEHVKLGRVVVASIAAVVDPFHSPWAGAGGLRLRALNASY
ncbi:hypothetical protein EVAR_16236_1 [Eumeta japonica]|uniref:Uncharacterized protein n=1 Tax=Eumeta variegata TaxID=151549 RepID=A0A4C1U5Y7_EUMVA|nr:hypothetical protein EVAR_16236_1 [Eumeta japonica]